MGSSSDLNLNGHLNYPNDIDRLLNDSPTDKIRKYRSDYDNNPPNTTSFIPAIVSTSGSYIVNLCDFYSYSLIGKLTACLQVQDFSFRNLAVDSSTSSDVFSSQVKSRVGNLLVKDTVLGVNLNLDGASITSKTHTHPSHSQISRLFIFRCFTGLVVSTSFIDL